LITPLPVALNQGVTVIFINLVPTLQTVGTILNSLVTTIVGAAGTGISAGLTLTLGL
jgi:hypothetical protein